MGSWQLINKINHTEIQPKNYFYLQQQTTLYNCYYFRENQHFFLLTTAAITSISSLFLH